ncbi:hypothetical protein [Alteromonas gracilis]|uniref:hypothetical protein n=1 Tax=Alteromonas gracilis TaxID=1479524 RepID=UPI00142D9FE2|nr:hypothetical protein [Alteromonas gracilis]
MRNQNPCTLPYRTGKGFVDTMSVFDKQLGPYCPQKGLLTVKVLADKNNQLNATGNE